jgi:hypothetical protein
MPELHYDTLVIRRVRALDKPTQHQYSGMLIHVKSLEITPTVCQGHH